MVLTLLAEEELGELIEIPKIVENPKAKWTSKPKSAPVHRQRSFKVRSEDGGLHFEVYQRQNINDSMDYSAGIVVVRREGSRLTLARYNGASHEHGDIVYKTHIHRATVKAAQEGRRPEFYAEATTRYRSVDGALVCLFEDYHIHWGQVEVAPDPPSLFP